MDPLTPGRAFLPPDSGQRRAFGAHLRRKARRSFQKSGISGPALKLGRAHRTQSSRQRGTCDVRLDEQARDEDGADDNGRNRDHTSHKRHARRAAPARVEEYWLVNHSDVRRRSDRRGFYALYMIL